MSLFARRLQLVVVYKIVHLILHFDITVVLVIDNKIFEALRELNFYFKAICSFLEVEISIFILFYENLACFCQASIKGSASIFSNE